MKFHIPALWEVKDIQFQYRKKVRVAITSAVSPSTGMWGSDEPFLHTSAYFIAHFWLGKEKWWKSKPDELTFAKS